MAERRGSWPWRKKNIAKVDKASLFSPAQPASPASSFKYDDAPQIVPNGRHEPTVSSALEDARYLEAVRLREEAEERARIFKEELSAALKEITTKEAMVKQHEKVAEEAVAGWEKAEKEALSYKQELEASAKQKTILEDRVAHLDGALKECMKQVKLVKEEQERKIDETILCKTREWETIKAEVDAKQVELERRLMESDAQNSVMAKSLQERARKILEANEAKERAETEVKVLQVKLSSLEKDISALKYELHVLNKELEIRNEEVEGNKKAADAAHKLHLENVKKLAKVEADCQRLRNLVRKKLPGPAAIAQMRREVEGPTLCRENLSNEMKRRPIRSPASSSTMSFSSSYQNGSISNNRDVELLKDRMSSMEEDTKFLKEVLHKRNEELQASRLLCAKTANKLSVAEDHIESLQGTPRERKMSGFDYKTNTELSAASMSEEDNSASNAEEASCAESWASALISELAVFKKGKPKSKDASKEAIESHISAMTSSSTEIVGDHVVLDHEENALSDATMQIKVLGINPAKLQEMSLLCRELDCKFCTLEEQARALKLENEESIKLAEEIILSSIDEAHQKFVLLKKAIQSMEYSFESSETHDARDAILRPEEDLPRTYALPVSNFHLIMNRLVILLETLLSLCKQRMENALADLDCYIKHEDDTHKAQTTSSCDQQKQALMSSLISSKDSFLEGKSSIFEFLVQLGIVLCGACDSESMELEELLMTVKTSPRQGPGFTDFNTSGYLNELSLVQDQLKQVMEVKTELEAQMASSLQELTGAKTELCECRKLVTDLQSKMDGLQNLERRLAEEETSKVQIQAKLEVAEGEVSKLQASVATLTLELADKKKLHEGAVAKCEELEHQLQDSRLIYEDEYNGLKVPDNDDSRLGKERELIAAKEKLAECQRTILALGKQLTALSSPPAELSPGGSFDTASLDSASIMMDQRMQMELSNGSSMEHHQQQQQQQHHHHHHNQNIQQQQNHHADGVLGVRYNNMVTPPQYTQCHTQSHRRLMPPPLPQSAWGGHTKRRGYEDSQEPALSWAHSNGSFTRGARLPSGLLSETDHLHHHGYQQQQPVRSARPAYVSQSCQYSQQRHYDGTSLQATWASSHPEEEERQLALTVYSPPHTAMSSPARSPARYVQQLGNGRGPGRTAVRTSLTESMNAAAAASSAADAVAAEFNSKQAKASTFGKLFSRSKHR